MQRNITLGLGVIDPPAFAWSPFCATDQSREAGQSSGARPWVICRHRARRPQAHKNMRAPQEIGERMACSATPIAGRLAAKDVGSHRNATSCAAGLCRRAVHQLPSRTDFAVLSRVVGGALAGAGGIEPPNGGIKIRCLTAWLRPNRLNRNARGRYLLRGPVRTTPGL